MSRIRKFIAPMLALAVLVVALSPGVAGAQESVEPPAGTDADDQFGESADPLRLVGGR